MDSQLTLRSPKIARPWAFKNLPPFHPVAVKLLKLTTDEGVPISRVQQVLRTDVAFSAEVLRLANSALLGTRNEVRSVSHAVMMLGLERLKALSMTIAMRDFLAASKGQNEMRLCWSYNLATAIIAEWLAGFLPIDPDACYTAGLLHDIGRLAILRVFPEGYTKMLAAIEEYQFDILRCEKALFEIDHCEAGGWLMEQWDFPEELRQVATMHHRAPTPTTPELVKVVFIAWQVADMLGYSPMATRTDASIQEITATLPEKAQQGIFSKLDALIEEVSVKVKACDPAAI